MWWRNIFVAMALLLVTIHPVKAETTTADFLAWDRDAQESFFEISMSMLTVIAAQVQPEIASCINDWYYADQELKRKRQEEILEAMPNWLEYGPTEVLLGYVEGACEQFRP